MTPEPSDVQRELERLLVERHGLTARGQGHGAEARALDGKIAGLAGQLGLDPSEVAGVGEALVNSPSEGKFVGEFVVRRRLSEVLYLPLGIALGAIVIGLGQPTFGVGIIVSAIVLFVLQGRARVDRLRVDESGELSLPGKLERLDWGSLAAIDLKYLIPWSSHGVDRAALGTVDLRFTLGDRSVVTLARGPLWRTAPQRAPVSYVHLDRLLADRAIAAGMKVERNQDGWTARR